MRVLVTGGTGFVGRYFVERAVRGPSTTVRAVVRGPVPPGQRLVEWVQLGEINSATRWTDALRDVDVVVHLAGRAHVMREVVGDPLDLYREINVEGSLNLARSAVAAGVKRMIFVSSVKVNGEGPPPGAATLTGSPYRETDQPAPEDPYGISKHEAEQRLGKIAAQSGLELVVIRPPLVYGPGVRANMRSLMKAIASGIPLPFARVQNRRSLVYVENLVDFIWRCRDARAAANETFLVSDGEDLSTPELIRRTAAAMGRPARLFPVSSKLLWAGARLLCQERPAQRLLGSLQVDITKARERLNWTPPVGVEAALRKTVAKL